MLGINYFKANPAEYARFSVSGKTRKQGNGASGFYLEHNTSIEAVSTTTTDQAFGFKEMSSDNQEISIQGGFVYKVAEPGKAMAAYNFAINPKTRQYLTDDSRKLPENILNTIRSSARRIAQKTKLEDILTMSDDLSNTVREELVKSGLTDALGVSIESLYITVIRPSPEIEKALGTEYREKLLQKADEAIYERRAKAVEQEKAIQENELNNKIQLESRRAELVKLQGDNAIAEARYKTDAAKMEMEVFSGLDSETIRAHAMYQLGRNASKIQSLTITPELLAGIKDGMKTA